MILSLSLSFATTGGVHGAGRPNSLPCGPQLHSGHSSVSCRETPKIRTAKLDSQARPREVGGERASPGLDGAVEDLPLDADVVGEPLEVHDPRRREACVEVRG